MSSLFSKVTSTKVATIVIGMFLLIDSACARNRANDAVNSENVWDQVAATPTPTPTSVPRGMSSDTITEPDSVAIEQVENSGRKPGAEPLGGSDGLEQKEESVQSPVYPQKPVKLTEEAVHTSPPTAPKATAPIEHQVQYTYDQRLQILQTVGHSIFKDYYMSFEGKDYKVAIESISHHPGQQESPQWHLEVKFGVYSRGNRDNRDKYTEVTPSRDELSKLMEFFQIQASRLIRGGYRLQPTAAPRDSHAPYNTSDISRWYKVLPTN